MIYIVSMSHAFLMSFYSLFDCGKMGTFNYFGIFCLVTTNLVSLLVMHLKWSLV